MIQRKQSLYLLLGTIALAVVFILDALFQSRPADMLPWYVPALIALGAVTAILALVTIFLYENRMLQRKLVVAVQVLDLIFIVVLLGGMFLTGTFDVLGGAPDAVDRTATAVLPAVAYVFFYLARRGIQSDIELVRSMDRLR